MATTATRGETPTAKAARLEKELAVFKSKVVGEIQRFRDSGDLCDDEFHNVRQNLSLEDLLPTTGFFKIESGSGDLKIKDISAPGVTGDLNLDNEDIISAVSSTLLDMLNAGMKVKGTKYMRNEGVKDFEAVVTFDGDLDQSEWEEG